MANKKLVLNMDGSITAHTMSHGDESANAYATVAPRAFGGEAEARGYLESLRAQMRAEQEEAQRQ